MHQTCRRELYTSSAAPGRQHNALADGLRKIQNPSGLLSYSRNLDPSPSRHPYVNDSRRRSVSGQHESPSDPRGAALRGADFDTPGRTWPRKYGPHVIVKIGNGLRRPRSYSTNSTLRAAPWTTGEHATQWLKYSVQTARLHRSTKSLRGRAHGTVPIVPFRRKRQALETQFINLRRLELK